MRKLVFISVPGLRRIDVERLPELRAMTSSGGMATLTSGFPAVTCPVQSNMTTGVRPDQHGIVANGLYLKNVDKVDLELRLESKLSGAKLFGNIVSSCNFDPEIKQPVWPKSENLPYIEMWTSPNSAVESPQIWDVLRGKQDNTYQRQFRIRRRKSINTGLPIFQSVRINRNSRVNKLKSAVWFALLSKFCLADYVCNFAPIHNPDGSESLWCYTRPYLFYGGLRDKLGHFPVQGYWGPLAGQSASEWIVDSAIIGANKFKPDYFYVYVPRLDYTPQKFGANASELSADLADLNKLFVKLRAGFTEALGCEPTWLIAGEYAVTDVSSVVYPNRILREMGLLSIEERNGQEYLLPSKSRCFALCDHQFSHIHFNDADPQLMQRVADKFRNESGIDEVLVGDERAKYNLTHRRSGEIILISEPDSWQAYYFWNDDSKVPEYARKVDIHRKPGYDPVELFFDRETMSVPLDANLIRGSHGAPARDNSQKTVVLASKPELLADKKQFDDIDMFNIVNQFFKGKV
ncbi:MAG: alkaline phosphatase family protein [Planctomycetaceae bacterium]|jgi:predicted AlkP superfamily pyrophosphatase or phosphodiesterase|nr:alkaline phosphatase family protein [Planctomycetaceae bacterium]